MVMLTRNGENMVGEESEYPIYIIGEKINGFVPRTCRAIMEKDAEYIKEIAAAQEEAAADFLDCSPATNEGDTDNFETMKWLIDLIHEASDLPIALDSPNADLLLQARDYCDELGIEPGIINSASLCEGKCDKIFSAIADSKWGCVVMLDDDENGIPKDAAGRIANYKKVMAKAAEYGISADRIYIDPLVETQAANDTALLTFAEVCRAIREDSEEVHITSGLSNISFGMPARKSCNQAFMVLAVEAGMDSAIVDPLNRDMVGIMFATNALLGRDEMNVDYMGGFREGLFGPVQA